MFCPYCGTKTTTGGASFCYECGKDMGAAGREQGQGAREQAEGTAGTRERQDWRASFGAPPFGHMNLGMEMRQVVGSRALRTMLGAVGAMALLLLAIPLLIAVVLLGLFATVAFVGVLFKLAPALLIGLLIYWVLSGRARAPRMHRGYREI